MAHPWPESDPALLAPVEEHEELRAVVRQVLTRHADHERVRAVADSDVGWSRELWDRLNGELEIGGLAVAEDLGGAGFGVRELAVVLEETGAALLPEPVLASAVLGCRALIEADDPDRVAELRTQALAGAAVVTTALHGEVRVTLGDDGWTVSGVAERVLQAEAAGHLVVAARAPEGAVLVLVERDHVETRPLEVVDLTRRQADVHLADAPATLVVGAERGDLVVGLLRRLALVAVASEHAGMISHLLDLTRDYAVQREQFDRPIGSFQAVKHRIADMLVDRERALSASRYAAALLDDPAVANDAADLAAVVAASVCQDAVVRVAHEAIQLHGGIGFTWEHRAHYYLRRALGDEGLFGSARQHRAAIATLIGV
jgi:alkylation response protein AidB-like acyl-CoA dehydrogenase